VQYFYSCFGDITAFWLVGYFVPCWKNSWDCRTAVPNPFGWEYLLWFMQKVGLFLFLPTKIPTYRAYSQPFRTIFPVFPTFFPQHNFPLLGFSICRILLLGIAFLQVSPHFPLLVERAVVCLVIHISCLCSHMFLNGSNKAMPVLPNLRIASK
jgi:hypothetical protein